MKIFYTILLVCALSLAGCGRKGDLTLPKTTAATAASAAAVAGQAPHGGRNGG